MDFVLVKQDDKVLNTQDKKETGYLALFLFYLSDQLLLLFLLGKASKSSLLYLDFEMLDCSLLIRDDGQEVPSLTEVKVSQG